jgi:hypothetical protein
MARLLIQRHFGVDLNRNSKTLTGSGEPEKICRLCPRPRR